MGSRLADIFTATGPPRRCATRVERFDRNCAGAAAAAWERSILEAVRERIFSAGGAGARCCCSREQVVSVGAAARPLRPRSLRPPSRAPRAPALSSEARHASVVPGAMAQLELYCLSWHPRTAKALIPAKLGGVELKIHEFAWPTELKSPEFLQLSPAGKAREAWLRTAARKHQRRNDLRRNTCNCIAASYKVDADSDANRFTRSRC